MVQTSFTVKCLDVIHFISTTTRSFSVDSRFGWLESLSTISVVQPMVWVMGLGSVAGTLLPVCRI